MTPDRLVSSQLLSSQSTGRSPSQKTSIDGTHPLLSVVTSIGLGSFRVSFRRHVPGVFQRLPVLAAQSNWFIHCIVRMTLVDWSRVSAAGVKGPKKESAIGFKLSGKAGSRSVLIAVVRYSSKGNAVSDSERWERGVKAVTRVMKKMEKRNMSFNDVKSKLAGCASQFGFTSLKLDIDKDTPEIMSAMSSDKLVYRPWLQHKGKGEKDAIPLKWSKVDYRPITIRNSKGKTVKVQSDEQTMLRSRGGRRTEPFGISSEYFKRSGKFQNKEERPNTKQATFRD